MRTSRRNLITTAAAALLGTTAEAIDSRQPAPRFQAKSLDGEKYSNDSLMGKPVLVQFWATWCGFCRKDQDSVDEITKEFAAKGLVVLAVNVGESRRKVMQYLDSNPRSCKIVLTEDTNLAAVWSARAFPLYVAIDRAGKFAGTQEGSSEAGLRRLLGKIGLNSE